MSDSIKKWVSLDSIWRCLLLWQIIIKITIGRRFFHFAQRSFTLGPISGTTPVQLFSQVKNPDGSNVIGEDGRLEVHEA